MHPTSPHPNPQREDLTGIARYLSASPTDLPLYVEPHLVDEFRRDTRVDQFVAKQSEFRRAASTYLQDVNGMFPGSPETPSFQALAAGLATVRTPYDTVKGPFVNAMGHEGLREVVVDQYARGLWYLSALTHRTPLMARLAMLGEGDVPDNAPRRDDLMEQYIAARRAPTFDDFEWTPTERLGDPKTADDARTTTVRAQGLWARMGECKGKPLICSPIVGNSDPHYVSALSADLAFLSLFYVPADGVHSDRTNGLKAQIEFLRVAGKLLLNHPLLWLHPRADEVIPGTSQTVRAHLLEEANMRLGVTLKVDNLKDLEYRVKTLVNDYGRRSFRLFDPRSTYNLPRGVEIVAKALEAAGFEDYSINAGLIIGESMALACANAGCTIFSMNTTEGDRCSTASGMNMVANNLVNAYRIQANPKLTKIGKILDGGIEQRWAALTAMGFHGAMKHGALFGGTICQAPGMVLILDERTGKPAKKNPGEAAKGSKAVARNFDPTGMPESVEGDDRHVYFLENPFGTTWPEIMWRSFYRAGAKACCFYGVQSLEALRRWNSPVFLQPTDAARRKAAPH